jgi:hypothetical protein
VPVHPQLRRDLTLWLEERPNWPGAGGTPALFLNQRGGRLSARGASDVVAALAEEASQEDETTAHVLRHTFGTTLIRGGADLVLVAELMGHARLEACDLHVGDDAPLAKGDLELSVKVVRGLATESVPGPGPEARPRTPQQRPGRLLKPVDFLGGGSRNW